MAVTGGSELSDDLSSVGLESDFSELRDSVSALRLESGLQHADTSSERRSEVGNRTIEFHHSAKDPIDLVKLMDVKHRQAGGETHRSLDEKSFSEIMNFPETAVRPPRALETVKSSECLEGMVSPGIRANSSSSTSQPRPQTTFEPNAMISSAWEALRKSLVHFRGKPVGTLAACDPTEDSLNYNQVFVRDFVPSGLAFLMNGEPEIVKNFLLKALRLQSWEKHIDCFTLGEGVMPASFKVLHDPSRKFDTMIADFGESAIGRVAPVDSGFWWIILLRAYVKSTGDHSLADMSDCQRGMRLILTLCLSDGFDTFPTLLCADGCCMIDRRMGIYGYPIEIQSLFFMALRCARFLLRPEAGGKEFLERIDKRLHALSFHIRTYYWLDHQQLNNIYRYKTEEYSQTAVNKFNVIPDSIPDWLFDWMPMKGGYFIGNVSPARMDFRWFTIGNCVAILSSLSTPDQSSAIMDLIEERWEELVGFMPLKVCYPALESLLLWMLTAASIKTGRPQIARKAIELMEARLMKDGWPEYYDGKLGRYIGKQARKFQTWSIAGYLVSKMMLEDPSHLGMISLEEDRKMKPSLTRSVSF
ncbi:hypothetical protein AXG93_2717s1030 [Marchantia polymorpha subsp. ruderalis]|uniref:Alkaline/neutral invertase n=1 Tax=Marchantia polymorpha subsp. ruderalis TaxID=1480154 RepID=A0A176VRG3_MARPO|nr:hypothetical protein AXG93_2717s1030 [Marchantia polymorpha subsp. ruderalis]